jgi:hypothetical protein
MEQEGFNWCICNAVVGIRLICAIYASSHQIRPHREVDSKVEELQRCLELRYKIDVADLKLGCRLQMGD